MCLAELLRETKLSDVSSICSRFVYTSKDLGRNSVNVDENRIDMVKTRTASDCVKNSTYVQKLREFRMKILS
jgi:hypothetical protein